MKDFFANIDLNTVLEVLKYIAMLILGAFSLYYQSNSKLKELANKYIATAQVLYKDNTTRFDWVVTEIYKVVPVALRPFITKAAVARLVQAMFDGAKAYAKASLDKAVDSLPDPAVGEE